MKTYTYILKLIERLWIETAWTDTDETIVVEHFNRLKIDFERGIVTHAGRTQNTDKSGFGVVIFKAEDDERAEKYMLSDPAVSGGIMNAEFYEYRIALG